MIIKRAFVLTLLLSVVVSFVACTAQPGLIPSPSPIGTSTFTPTIQSVASATLRLRPMASPTVAAAPTEARSQRELPAPTSVPQPLPPFTVDLSQPFAGTMSSALKAWTSQPYAGPALTLPIDLSQLANPHVLDGLTAAQKTLLAKNGFVALHSQEAQFGDIRVETAHRTGQPYYLTTDAAFHALHLNFDELLKALERQQLHPQMMALTQATLQEVRASFLAAQGTSLEAESKQSLAYLSVALKLFDPKVEIDSSVADVVSQQVAQIMAAGGKANSVLFPDFEDDYGAYKPVGHYAGDPELEAYFRGMTWLGRVHFRLTDPENPKFVPSHLPLIVTLALRHAQVGARPASDAWLSLYQTLNFVIGPSDDAGPLEYAALMDTVYGPNPMPQDVADEARWQAFLSHSDQLPAPQINALFVSSTVDLQPEKGWRFMGQRFTLDGLIFQNLIFDKVQARPNGERREFPSGLDVMAAFGSTPALKSLNDSGVTTFPNYLDQMTKMQRAVQSQPEQQWLGRFYDGWLYSFLPVLSTKSAAFPAYMQTAAWGYKDLNTALGSWAELKHDTILYTKMPEGAGGGGPPTSSPALSYVEPNPDAFFRMAYMASSLASGLQTRFGSNLQDGTEERPDLSDYVQGLTDLGERFQQLGDIAVKELAGEPLTQDENYIMTACLGINECLHEGPVDPPEMPKPPIIAAVSGARASVLEVGIGNIDRLYVVVPLENQKEVAQGGVFSYYEFTQPRDQRLTDEEWRAKLAGNNAPTLPAWTSNFVMTGGRPTEQLVFRKGDVYIITAAGDQLNMRDKPSTSGQVLGQLKAGDYIQIIDGAVDADGHTWWKFQSFYDSTLIGWGVENQAWYARSFW